MSQKITHQLIWKNNPKENKTMVSNFAHLTFPSLKKIRPKKILDAACGNGIGVSLPLLRLGYDVYAFDHHKSAISAYKMNILDEGFKPKLKKADMYRRFPYKNGEFDAVYCFQAIYHGRLEQIRFTLEEIHRVLRKGGYFFATFARNEDIIYDPKRKMYYFLVDKGNTVIKSWVKQDKKQPHLYYFLSKDWEYMVPHYYIAKDELRGLLGKYFRDIELKIVTMKHDKYGKFWLVSCRK